MEQFVKNSKGQMIAVSHIRELSIVSNDYDEKFEIVGSYGNGDELFLGSYGSQKEAEEVLEEIVGEVQDISVCSKAVTVLAPAEDSEEVSEDTEESEDKGFLGFFPDSVYSDETEDYSEFVEPDGYSEEGSEYEEEVEDEAIYDEALGSISTPEEPFLSDKEEDVEEAGDEDDEQERGEESEEEDGEQ